MNASVLNNPPVASPRPEASPDCRVEDDAVAAVRLVNGSRDAAAAEPFAGWTYLTDRRELVSPEGVHRHLSHHEGRLLVCFAEVAFKVVDRDYLMRKVCQRRWCPEDRYIDVLVGTLRRKLGESAATQKMIRTVHGVGYVFDAHVMRRNGGGGKDRANPPGSGGRAGAGLAAQRGAVRRTAATT